MRVLFQWNCIDIFPFDQINRIDGKDTHYLLLDEIQLLGNFESVLNGYLRKSNLDIYVSGSNARFLSKDVISEFAGRGFEIHLSPLSFSEFMQVYSGDKYEGLAWYMLYGGLPLVVLNPDEETKMKLLDSLFDEIDRSPMSLTEGSFV